MDGKPQRMRSTTEQGSGFIRSAEYESYVLRTQRNTAMDLDF